MGKKICSVFLILVLITGGIAITTITASAKSIVVEQIQEDVSNVPKALSELFTILGRKTKTNSFTSEDAKALKSALLKVGEGLKSMAPKGNPKPPRIDSVDLSQLPGPSLGGLQGFLNSVIRMGGYLAGSVMLLLLVVASFLLIRGNQEAFEQFRARVMNIFIGGTLVFSSFIIVSIIWGIAWF